MKSNLILVSVLLVGLNASADKVSDTVVKGGAAAKAATAGGKAAVSATVGAGATAAKSAADIAASAKAIAASLRPTDEAAFQSQLISKVPNMDRATAEKLVNAYRTGVMDRGCLDANLAQENYIQFLAIVEDAVRANLQKGTTVGGLNQVAKTFGGSAEADREAANAGAELDRQGASVVANYSKLYSKTKAEAQKAVMALANQCGLAQPLATHSL